MIDIIIGAIALILFPIWIVVLAIFVIIRAIYDELWELTNIFIPKCSHCGYVCDCPEGFGTN